MAVSNVSCKRTLKVRDAGMSGQSVLRGRQPSASASIHVLTAIEHAPVTYDDTKHSVGCHRWRGGNSYISPAVTSREAQSGSKDEK